MSYCGFDTFYHPTAVCLTNSVCRSTCKNIALTSKLSKLSKRFRCNHEHFEGILRKAAARCESMQISEEFKVKRISQRKRLHDEQAIHDLVKIRKDYFHANIYNAVMDGIIDKTNKVVPQKHIVVK